MVKAKMRERWVDGPYFRKTWKLLCDQMRRNGVNPPKRPQVRKMNVRDLPIEEQRKITAGWDKRKAG
jgi:hypothetical protein